jgi:hypothetical protein
MLPPAAAAAGGGELERRARSGFSSTWVAQRFSARAGGSGAPPRLGNRWPSGRTTPACHGLRCGGRGDKQEKNIERWDPLSSGSKGKIDISYSRSHMSGPLTVET